MPERILVVEDDLLNRMFLCATLEANGLEVRMVTDGAHVLEAAREFCPDLITMDINLPSISGVDLIKMFKADGQLRGIPILAITAYVGKGEESHIRGAGASEYLAKPISIRPFLATVERLLGHSQQADRNGLGFAAKPRTSH
jgi:two-component system, cell cycle response regulator DivK